MGKRKMRVIEQAVALTLPRRDEARRVDRTEAGFTLIEILLALGILTSISIFSIQMLGNQVETRNKLTLVNSAQHALHAAMARVFDDLRHVYVISKADAGFANLDGRTVKPGLFARSSADFRFTAQNFGSYQANAPESNIAHIRYVVRKDENDANKQMLVRIFDTEMKESLEYDGVGVEQILVPDLAEFKVTYWDGADFSREDWDTENQEMKGILPKMAKISISTFLPRTDAEQQRIELSAAENEERQKLTLETIVYLLYSSGLPEVKAPGKEYMRWH